MMKTEHGSTPFIRIGNQAVREAQERNRQCGIPNWYSLNGLLVSDASPGQGAGAPDGPVRGRGLSQGFAQNADTDTVVADTCLNN